MDSQKNNITEAALGLSDQANVEEIDMTFQLSPDQLEYLEIVRDSVKSAKRGNMYFVPRKLAGIIKENVADICGQNAPTNGTLNQSMATEVQILKPKINVVRLPYARRRKNVVKCGRIFLLDALAESLRKAAIQRSLNFVLSVTLPRQMSLLITNKHTKIVLSKMSPVQLPVIISPRQIESNPIEEIPEGPIVMISADNNDERLKEGASAKRKRRRILSVFGRQLLKIGRKLFCWCGAPSSVEKDKSRKTL